MSQPCETCNGLCCRYFCFQIDTPSDYDDYEDIRWYLCHQGVSVHIDEDGDWFIQINNPCLKLDENNRCVIYEDRPLICRNYGENCELTGDDYGYQEEFKNAEDFDRYVYKTLGREQYEKDMVKFRAKAHKQPKKTMKAHLMGLGLLPRKNVYKKTTDKAKKKA